MLNFIFLLHSLLSYGNPIACQQLSSIKVNVTRVSSKKGDILAALYSSDKGFPGNSSGAFKIARATPVNGTALLEFSQVPNGTYAIALFHDTNSDGKLNTNFLGIPKEGYGVSNNVKNLFSAPGYKQCAFPHHGTTRIDITMRY